jgi:preprotein translocase subunit SecD
MSKILGATRVCCCFLAVAISLGTPLALSSCSSNRKPTESASHAATPVPVLQFAEVADPGETANVVEYKYGEDTVRIRTPRTFEIKDAGPAHDTFGYPAVRFEIVDSQQAEFWKWTAGLVGHQMAILLDGKIVLTPKVNSALPGRGVVENGPNHWTDEEVKAIAARIRSQIHVR